jgi:hypothetical protein
VSSVDLPYIRFPVLGLSSFWRPVFTHRIYVCEIKHGKGEVRSARRRHELCRQAAQFCARTDRFNAGLPHWLEKRWSECVDVHIYRVEKQQSALTLFAGDLQTSERVGALGVSAIRTDAGKIGRKGPGVWSGLIHCYINFYRELRGTIFTFTLRSRGNFLS